MPAYRCTECTLMRCDQPDQICGECGDNMPKKACHHKSAASSVDVYTLRPGVNTGLVAKYPLLGKTNQRAAEEILYWIHYNIGINGAMGHLSDQKFWQDVYLKITQIYNGATP